MARRRARDLRPRQELSGLRARRGNNVKTGDLSKGVNLAEIGQDMHGLIAKLYPICRSITGNGVRETLAILKTLIPLDVKEVPSGTEVFDWTVPKEWNINDAYIKNDHGERIVDFRESNLHVVSYSVPVHAKMNLRDLKDHLFSLPEHPDWIPYRTSYYKESWGFCLSNDNLSGVALVTYLAKHLSQLSLRYSYRFLFIPGTIGSITWLALNEAHVSRIKHGLVVAGVGDPGKSTYKKSRRGNAEIDKAVMHVLQHSGADFEVMDFSPYGYDERQFCSPGFDLPVGAFMRTPHSRYPEYHTSADNLSFVQPQYLTDSFAKSLSIMNVLESNMTYLNQNPKGEPQLGKRGLYGAMGGSTDQKLSELATLWVLNLSDGDHSLLDIAERSGLEFRLIRDAADILLAHRLLQEQSK